MYQQCCRCRQQTKDRGPFGEWLCKACWADEDEEIDSYLSKQPY